MCLHNQTPFNASRIDCLVYRKRTGLKESYPQLGDTKVLDDLSQKIDAIFQSVYTSQKIKGQFKGKEHKTKAFMNQQNLYYN